MIELFGRQFIQKNKITPRGIHGSSTACLGHILIILSYEY
jgi:hypothetical protein